MVETQLIQTNSASHQRNANRVAQDEAELRELLKQAGVIQDEEAQEEEEQVAEAQPRSPKPSAEPVQAESSAKQKEEPKAEAQESDDSLSAEEKTFKQRYADIQRHMQKTADQHKEEIEKLKKQLEQLLRMSLYYLSQKTR